MIYPTSWPFLTKPSVATNGVMTATDFDDIASLRNVLSFVLE